MIGQFLSLDFFNFGVVFIAIAKIAFMSAGFYRGTSLDQDTRFNDKDAKLKASMTFPPCFKKQV
jgi:hypothetical protein